MSKNVKPRFEVHKLEGTGLRKVAKPKTDKKGNLIGGFEFKEDEVDAGWMIYFPNGSSIHVWTEDEMKRQGFLAPVTLVDLDTGDDVGVAPSNNLKKHSEQKQKVSKSSKVHHTGSVVAA